MTVETSNGQGADQPRVAVIGCGAWGRNIVRCFAQLGALSAVVDNNAETIESLIALFGCRAMSAEQALSSPDIDAVVIATPPSGHKDMALAAIAQGKHVFIEKPVTLDHEEAVAIVDAARAGSRVMMTGHILQFHPGYRKLKELVRDGVLGRVQRINANRLNLGAVRREEDALWCLAPHDVSMTLGLVGGAPVHVDAHGEGHLRDEIADAVTLRLAFEGGEKALIHVSWLHPFKEHRLSVVGSQGMAVFDDCLPWDRKLQLYPHRVSLDGTGPQVVRAEPVPVEIVQNEPLLAECAHFLDCIRDGSEPITGPIEALSVMHVLERARQSMAVQQAAMRAAGA
jgi:predicted dehydrogenase